MVLNSSQAFYLLIDDKGIASMSMTLLELYEKKRDTDGFLYMSYASQGIRTKKFYIFIAVLPIHPLTRLLKFPFICL
jgi:hypothetical protein